MKYLVTLPCAPYLAQYVRHHYGRTVSGAVNISGCIPAANTLKRNLFPFPSEDAAKRKWPQSFSGVRVELPDLERRNPRPGENENTFFTIGPAGRVEVLSILQSLFDMVLVTDWTTTCAYYSKLMSLPSKKEFIDAFLERNGIEVSETEHCAVEKRLMRILTKASDFVPPTETY